MRAALWCSCVGGLDTRAKGRLVMNRRRSVFVAMVLALASEAASAQQRDSDAGRVEVTAFPVGGIVFTSGENGAQPGFGDYALGAAITINASRHLAIEYEVAGGLGVEQRLQFGSGRSVGDVVPPDILAYNVNLVISPVGNERSLVPYVAGGIGGLTVFEEKTIGFDTRETFFSGNVGGGVKWFFGRWGVRGDYRLVAIHAEHDAPAFFARGTRYAHRVYAGIVVHFCWLEVNASERR